LIKDICNHTKHAIIDDTAHHKHYKHYAEAFQNQDSKKIVEKKPGFRPQNNHLVSKLAFCHPLI